MNFKKVSQLPALASLNPNDQFLASYAGNSYSLRYETLSSDLKEKIGGQSPTGLRDLLYDDFIKIAIDVKADPDVHAVQTFTPGMDFIIIPSSIEYATGSSTSQFYNPYKYISVKDLNIDMSPIELTHIAFAFPSYAWQDTIYGSTTRTTYLRRIPFPASTQLRFEAPTTGSSTYRFHFWFAPVGKLLDMTKVYMQRIGEGLPGEPVSTTKSFYRYNNTDIPGEHKYYIFNNGEDDNCYFQINHFGSGVWSTRIRIVNNSNNYVYIEFRPNNFQLDKRKAHTIAMVSGNPQISRQAMNMNTKIKKYFILPHSVCPNTEYSLTNSRAWEPTTRSWLPYMTDDAIGINLDDTADYYIEYTKFERPY